MRKILYFLLIALLPAAAMAQTKNEQQIIQTINKASAGLKSMECDFVQTKHLKMLNDKMVANGKMYYKQPDKLHWEYTSPYKYTFILNDNKVVLKKNGRNDVIDINQNKMFREIARLIMNTVVGKSLGDGKTFKASVKETPSEWTVTLVPQKKEMKQMWTTIVLTFSRSQQMISKVRMCEKNGDYTLIEMKNVKMNKLVSDAHFNVR